MVFTRVSCFDDTDFDQLQSGRRRSLEKRVGKADVSAAVLSLGNSLLGLSGSDDVKRANGIRNMVDGMAKQFAGWNAVACHTDHDAKFDGVESTDWFHDHFEIDVELGGTIGYEVCVLAPLVPPPVVLMSTGSPSCTSVEAGRSSATAMAATSTGAGECLRYNFCQQSIEKVHRNGFLAKDPEEDGSLITWAPKQV